MKDSMLGTFQCEVDGTQGCGVESVSWSSDGHRVAAGGASPPPRSQLSAGFVTVCDATSGERIFGARREAKVTCVSFSIDDGGNRLALSRVDGIVEILDAHQGDPLQKIRLRGFGERFSHRTPFAGLSPDLPLPPRSGAPPTPCGCVAWSNCGEILAVAKTTTAVVCNLNLAYGLLSYPDQTNKDSANSLPKTIGAGVDDDEADDVQTIVCECKFNDSTLVEACALSPKTQQGGFQLIAFCGGPTVCIARADDGRVIAERRLDDFASGHNWSNALSLAFCPPRGTQPLVFNSAQTPASARAKETKTPEEQQQKQNAQANTKNDEDSLSKEEKKKQTEVSDEAASKNDKKKEAFSAGSRLRLVAGGELAAGRSNGGAVAVFDAVDGLLLSVHQARSAVSCVAVAADGRSMALGERRGDQLAQAQAQLQQQERAAQLAQLQQQAQQREQQQQAPQGQQQQGVGQPPQEKAGTQQAQQQAQQAQQAQQQVHDSPAAAPGTPAFTFGAGSTGTRIETPKAPEKEEDSTFSFDLSIILFGARCYDGAPVHARPAQEVYRESHRRRGPGQGEVVSSSSFLFVALT